MRLTILAVTVILAITVYFTQRSPVQATPALPEPATSAVIKHFEHTHPDGCRYSGIVVVSRAVEKIETGEAVRLISYDARIAYPDGRNARFSGIKPVPLRSTEPLRNRGAEFFDQDDAGSLGIGSFGISFEVATSVPWLRATKENVTIDLHIEPVASEEDWLDWAERDAQRP